MTEMLITDRDGRPIRVGTRVRTKDFDPSHEMWGQKPDTSQRFSENSYMGTVISLGDGVEHTTRVRVMFDDETRDSFPVIDWEFTYPKNDIRGIVDEVLAIAAPQVGRVRLRV